MSYNLEEEILRELKKEYFVRIASISSSSISLLGFVYFSNMKELKPSVICSILSVISMHMVKNSNYEINNLKKELKKKQGE